MFVTISFSFQIITAKQISTFHNPKCSNFSKNQMINSMTSNNNPELSRIISEMYIDVLENGEDAFVENHHTYYNHGTQNVSWIIQEIEILTILTESRISSFIVYDAFGDLSYSWSIQSSIHIINITLREELTPQEFISFSFSYLIENAITRTELTQNYILQLSLTYDESIEQFSLIATLPAKYEILNESAADPDPIYQSVDGRRLEWKFNNILADQTKTWIVRFQLYEQYTTPPDEFRIVYWIGGLVATFIFGLLLGTLGMFYTVKFRTDTERKIIVETLLSQPEKEILKIIKDDGGVITQNKIVSLTEFSKAKVSYYLTELEKKKIIQRERWGRMNRIRIIDDSVDKVFIKDQQQSE
jgi:hypothetical protein